MLSTKFQTNDSLVRDILDAPLGQVVTTLGNYPNCTTKLDLIEQNTPKPGTEFERKITVTVNDLPLIKAIIKFDKKTLPKYMVNQLLQKRILVGTILNLNNIPNKKNLISIKEKDQKLSRVYQIKHGENVFFEISEEIQLDTISVISKDFGIS